MTVYQLITGSYASSEEQGIKLWEFDDENGTFTEKGGTGGIDRPSFIAVHPDGHHFVASSETGDGELVSYRFDPSVNKISEISRRKSNGDHPAHVCIDEAGEWLLSVNYSGGNVNVYPLKGDGSIGELADSVKHEGAGPNAERQDAPHPHSVFQMPGTDFFLVSDLGTDTIYTYELFRESGRLHLKQAFQAKPESGPRHLAFHPSKPVVYSLGELDSSVSVYIPGTDGALAFLQAVSLLPDGYSGTNTSAEVSVSADGRFLYASNRGHDSIVSFGIKEDGTLENARFTESGGKGPRHFTLIPGAGWLIAANENSGTLSALGIGPDGVPETPALAAETKEPVCVKVIGSKKAQRK